MLVVQLCSYWGAVYNSLLCCYRSAPSSDQGVYSSQIHDRIEELELYMQFHISAIIYMSLKD